MVIVNCEGCSFTLRLMERQSWLSIFSYISFSPTVSRSTPSHLGLYFSLSLSLLCSLFLDFSLQLYQNPLSLSPIFSQLLPCLYFIFFPTLLFFFPASFLLFHSLSIAALFLSFVLLFFSFTLPLHPLTLASLPSMLVFVPFSTSFHLSCFTSFPASYFPFPSFF